MNCMEGRATPFPPCKTRIPAPRGKELLLPLNRNQLNLEDQSGIGPDLGPGAAIAVSKAGGNVKNPLGPFFHELQGKHRG